MRPLSHRRSGAQSRRLTKKPDGALKPDSPHARNCSLENWCALIAKHRWQLSRQSTGLEAAVSIAISPMIRELCEKKNISLAELARLIGQSPQNFNKKLKRGTVSFEEMMEIAGTLGVRYEQAFIMSDGEKIGFC